jgi:PAS domain S-box-containing protein
MRIRTRIIVAVLAVVGVANAGYHLYFTERERSRALALLDAHIAEVNELLKIVVAEPLYDGNQAQLENIMDSFFRDPDMVALRLTEFRGDITLQRERALDGLTASRRIATKVVVPRGIDQLGEIEAVYTTDNIEQRLAASRNQAIGFAAILAAGLMVAVWLLARGLSAPIHRLAESARKMADGDLEQPIASENVQELSVLADSLDRMRHAIGEKVEALARNNRELTAEIEQRREAESARDRLVAVMEAATDVVSLGDTQARILYMNRAGRLLSGVGDTPAQELRIPQFHPAWVGELILSKAIPVAMREGSWVGETVFLAADGREVPMSQVILAHKDEQGQVQFMSTIMRDISESRRAADEIRRLNQDLERRVAERTAELAVANRELESFASSVAHDLRAPLRAVDGFGKILDDRAGASLDAESRGYLQRIRASAQRMGRLIDELLKFSRIGRSDLRKRSVDMSLLARSVAEDLSRTAPERAVEWQIEPELKAWGDMELLHLVLENLLGNAWKYTSKTDGARIEFGSASAPAGLQAFFVRDNGAGFDMAHAQLLFQPFRRLHGQHEFEGTGIGLATVHRIIERHGGTIEAKAEVGRGATFRFTLPVADKEDSP